MNFRVTKDVNQNDIDEIHEMLKLYNRRTKSFEKPSQTA